MNEIREEELNLESGKYGSDNVASEEGWNKLSLFICITIRDKIKMEWTR